MKYLRNRFFLLIAFGLAFIGNIPFVAATNALITKVALAPVPFYFNVPGQSATFNIEYEFYTGGATTAPLIEEIRDQNNNIIYQFGNNSGPNGADDKTTGKYQLKWDGRYKNGGISDGKYVPEGKYKVYLYSETSSPPAVVYNSDFFDAYPTMAPTISLKTIPAIIYYTTSNNPYSIDYKLSRGTNTDTTVRLKISGPQGKPIDTIVNDVKKTDGDFTIQWNGKSDNNTATAGSYTYSLEAISSVNGYSVESLPIMGSLIVSESSPSTPLVTDLSTAPNPYNPDTKPPNCNGFVDIPETDPDCEAIAYVKSIGAMTGNPDGTFDRQGLLQRDQIVKIILETFKKFDKKVDYCPTSIPFQDVNQDNNWAFQYICRGKTLGLITGYLSGPDMGNYRPSRFVNRSEFLALLLRNIKDTIPNKESTSYTDVQPEDWYAGFAKYAKDKNIFPGAKLNPTNFVTRQEVAKIIFQLNSLGKI